MRHLFLAMLIAACSDAQPTAEPAFPDLCEGYRAAANPPVQRPEADWCKLHRCEVAGIRSYSPDANIASLTCKEMKRWQAATGVEMRLEDKATRVSFSDELWAPDPNDANSLLLPLSPICGRTLLRWDDQGHLEVVSIQINSNPPEGCEDAEHSMLHELGHSLAGNILHTKRGLMSVTSYPNGLDDESMSLICSYEPCTKFIPERYLSVQP